MLLVKLDLNSATTPPVTMPSLNGHCGSLMTFGERLRAAREAAGMTQEQLGGHLGVSNVAISAWESGRDDPSFKYLAPICHALHSSLDELILGQRPYPIAAASPPSVREPPPRNASKSAPASADAALELALQGVLMALIENVPASAGTFVEAIEALAGRRKGPTGEPLVDDALLGPLLYIARQASRKRAASSRREALRSAAPKPK